MTAQRPSRSASFRDLVFCLALAPLGFAWGACFGAALPDGLVRTLVLALLAYPILEEIVFRRGVQSGLRTCAESCGACPPQWPATLSVTATALAFGALHAAARGPLVGATVIVPALAIGALYERHRSLALCIVVHAGWNAAYLGGAWWGDPGSRVR